MDKAKPKLRERALFLFHPDAGNRAYRRRLAQEREAAGERAPSLPHGTRMAATGYGNHGASTTLNSLVGWLVGGGSAEDDSDLHGALLRARSRDLYAGGGLARSGIDVLTNNVVAWGIRPKPSIDGEALGMSEEACDEWERIALREFRLWAENQMCDAERQENFYGLQKLAFRSMLVSGDAFAIFGMKENKRTPYQTTIRILEADRVSTPDGSAGESESRETAGGGRIVDGVEIDKEGAVIRYHIANRHPLMESNSTDIEWKSIDAFGKETGFPNILHIMVRERPEQRRGVPFVASVIEQTKQLERYMNAELAANVVASLFALFLTSDADDGMMGIEDAVNEDEKVTDDELKVELAPGAVFELPPGKKVADVNPGRANTAFADFVEAMQTAIGASMGIAKEVLIQKYESNYTAARAAKLDFWRLVTIYRQGFNDIFNQRVYEAWLSEAVAAGRIEAPGFFDDPIIRQAWCGCTWMGASMGHIDPLKEVNAAEKRISLNITTEEQEAAEYNGNDWRSNIRQRKLEKTAFDDLKKKEGENNAE